jgi:hypothetical protein
MADYLFPDGKPDWEVLINPTSKQRAFTNEFFTKDYTLYGGAAGSGKSYILRWTQCVTSSCPTCTEAVR